MSYTPPSVGASGLTIPAYADILSFLIGQFQGIYGNAAYLGPDSSDYQDIAVRALQASDAAQALQAIYLSFNPLTAVGTSLDLIGKLIGTPRKSASFSTAIVTLAGTPGAVITGGIAKDVNGNTWGLASPAVIGGGGTVSVIATAQVAGSITANPGEISIIASPTAGWTSVTNAAPATPGNPVERDSQYRARLLLSQAKPSLTRLAGTAAAVAAVSGVTRSIVYENATNSTDANGNPAHSITCVVEGGAAADIAAAIYANRGVGPYTNGSTLITVSDPLNPAISMPISFYILAYVPVYVVLNVQALSGFTSAVQSAIASGVVDYLNALGIGKSVVFSELYGAALRARPDPEQPLFSIQSIQSGSAAAQTTGTLTNASPTVTVASATGIAVGQRVTGAGVPSNTTVSAVSGTTITLSQNATATGTGVALSFFAVGTSNIAIAFNKAAQGAPLNVVVNLV